MRRLTGGWLNTVRAALLSGVFPAGCRICEQLLTEATRIPIRNDCLGSFGLISRTICGEVREACRRTCEIWRGNVCLPHVRKR
jgi:hypothetical protein